MFVLFIFPLHSLLQYGGDILSFVPDEQHCIFLLQDVSIFIPFPPSFVVGKKGGAINAAKDK